MDSADESQATIDEIEEIRTGVEIERQATEGFRLKGWSWLSSNHADCFPIQVIERDDFKRTFASFAVFAAQQCVFFVSFLHSY